MALGVLQHRAQDSAGNLIAADLRVRRETAALPLVTLYSDRDGDNQISNPTVGGFFSDGKIRAYVASGNYRVELLVGGEVVDTLYNVPVIDIPPTVREVLDAARTYYVRTDGSDSNNGLSDTAGGAFLTIQAAYNAAAALDFNGFTVTIQVRDGTYAAGVNATAAWLGGGTLIFQGNSGTPANVHVSVTGSCFKASVPLSGILRIRDMKLTATVRCIWSNAPALVEFVNVEFGAADFQIAADAPGAYVRSAGNYSIVAGATAHALAGQTGFVQVSNNTVTLTGTPAFSFAFCYATRNGVATFTSNTFSGSATGTRYIAEVNASIYTAGGGASYLPGNAAGSTATGGQYV